MISLNSCEQGEIDYCRYWYFESNDMAIIAEDLEDGDIKLHIKNKSNKFSREAFLEEVFCEITIQPVEAPIKFK